MWQHAVLYWKMTEQESKVYQMALQWIELCEKLLPNYKHTKLPVKGDPRKGILFKHCWKLERSLKGILPENELQLYMKAQIIILKGIGEADQHALITPVCLTGPKAWKRWLLYKNKFLRSTKVNKTEIAAYDPKTIAQLKNTKAFLLKTFNNKIEADDICNAVKNLTMFRWVSVGKITPHYVLLSPLVSKCISSNDLQSYFKFDLDVYKSALTPEVKAYFKQEFANEYQ